MTDPNRSAAEDLGDPGDAAALDPERHSTWNTIDSAVDVDEVLDESDLENFFIEPIPNPLDPTAGQDDAGASS